jgi:glycosyltransferase involved in cell wall biosynthesis
MPLCSIITAASSSHARFTSECWSSIAAQRDLGSWELEWCVQEDGVTPRLRERLPVDERIRYAAVCLQHGAATTRNLALARARGEVVRVLDQDDLLLPFALRDQLGAFEACPRAAWVAGRAADLLPDGSTRLVEVELPAGVVEPGALLRAWQETGIFPVHTAGVGFRTAVARAFGGWAALPRSEDLSLLAAISTVFAGVFMPNVTFLYRQWAGQMTRTESFASAQEAAWRSVRQRADALGQVFAALGRDLAGDQRSEIPRWQAACMDGDTGLPSRADRAGRPRSSTAGGDGPS